MDTRKVQRPGHIVYGQQMIFISTALRGWSVGLEPVAGHNRFNVWFGRLLLGELDAQTASFQRTKATTQDLQTSEPASELTQIKRHRRRGTEGRQEGSLTHGKKTPAVGVK
jgi:hypothetical protein